VAATLAVVGVIVGEWLGGSEGLGVLLNLARGSLFDTPLLFAALLQIAILGVTAYGAVILAERLTSRLTR
jgi:NitT/TauT family transport system permease protein